MTVDVAPRTRRRVPRPGVRSASPGPEQMAAPGTSMTIGEIDQTVFDCPSCSRPLALGARRCPGCGTRLVRGITLGKAASFAALGLVIGLAIGAGGGLLFGLSNAPAAVPAVAAGPSDAPGGGVPSAAPASAAATPSPTAQPARTPPPSTISSVTRSALGQVVATNERLATSAVALREAMSAKAFDASTVAGVLRAISADSVFGEQLSDRLVAWPVADPLGARLATFYGSIHDVAADGLDASVRNTAAYRASGATMIELLAGLEPLDAALRSAASSAGVVLPTASPTP